jgi:transposase
LRTLERPREEVVDLSAIVRRLDQVENALSKSEKRANDLLKKLKASEKRAQRLEWRILELEAENRMLREQRSGTEEVLRKEIDRLELKVAKLTGKLEAAQKQLVWFQNNQFNRKTEKDGAGSQSAEPGSGDADNDAENSVSKKKKGQPQGSKGHGRSDRSEVETVVEYLDIPGGCACDTCGTSYRLLPRTEASPITEFEATVIRTVFQRCLYVSQCKCNGRQIKMAPPPPKLLPRSEIGNSLWIHLFVQKFLHGVPTNRVLKDLSLYGFHLAEGTVTGGCKIINDLLAPLMEELVNHCRGASLWNADETTWRVFSEDKQKWWFWLIASDDAVVYILDPSRSKKVPNDFFAGSAGILMTDKFSSYKSLHEGIRKAWCLVHLRRDILNVYNGMPALKAWAKSWLLDIATLFIRNDTRFKLWKNEETSGPQWDQAVHELEAHVEKLKDRWQNELKQTNLHKQQSKILRSMKRHWPGYTLFLEDPRIPLHNNRAERLLRNPVILRKNSFGSGAPWAGHLAAKVFSIFQTWLINGLDPKALLLDYFTECSKTPGKPPPDISQFMPWTMSAERRAQFALPESYERPG